MKRWKREPKKTDNSEEEERASTITIPYVKGVSEKIAREFKKHNIQTIHKPTTKLKHVLFNKMKDKVNDLDRSGVIYKIDCKRHKEIYIGETGRPMKERGREHRVVTCEDAKKNHSIRDNNNNSTREIERNATQSGVRRSTRNKVRQNYQDLHTGRKIMITEGSTEVSSHLALHDHEENDVEFTKIEIERNKKKREIKEALHINRQNPTLNKDDGRYILLNIYDTLVIPANKDRNRGKEQDHGSRLQMA